MDSIIIYYNMMVWKKNVLSDIILRNKKVSEFTYLMDLINDKNI